jgi:TIR domain
LDTIRRISEEINARYNWLEASTFLRAFYKDAHTYRDDYDSVFEMASLNLAQVEVSVLGEMIDDLGIESISYISSTVQRPRAWENTDKFRLFLCHVSKDKDKAHRTREALAAYNIAAFVAHDDIEPTLEWQVQIERALHSMEAYVSIHTEGYKESTWCQQETGFAVGRGTKVIALRMGEDPTGFISKHQAISRGTKKAEDVAMEIVALLQDDVRTNARYVQCNPPRSGYDGLDDDVPF